MILKVKDVDLALPHRLAVVALVYGLDKAEDCTATVLGFDGGSEAAFVNFH